jgi:N-methylhydantoinase B
VLRDVVRGVVSRESAAEDYGVVLEGDGEELTLDEPATDARREEIRRTRQPLEMFDRGEYFERLRGTS